MAAVAGVTVTMVGDRIPLNRSGSTNSANGGGWVVTGGALVVLNGTGAGQVRRIVGSAGPRGWTLDSPLGPLDLAGGAAGSDAPTFVQIMPFRGRNTFHGNHLSDCGALQFYGIAFGMFRNVVAENKLERMAGVVSWGQWRQWRPVAPAPPPVAGEEGVFSTQTRLGGEMGCGANPNLFNVFERNDFVEGNAIVNYNTPEGASYNWGAGYLLSSSNGVVADSPGNPWFEDLSMNSFTVIRANVIRSNGGILVTADSENVLVEHNSIVHSDLQLCVTNTTRSVLLVGNDARVECML